MFSETLQQVKVPAVGYAECAVPYQNMGAKLTKALTLCYGNVTTGEGDACFVSRIIPKIYEL